MSVVWSRGGGHEVDEWVIFGRSQDYANNRIRTVKGTVITTFAGNGGNVSSGNGAAATSAGVVRPMSVCPLKYLSPCHAPPTNPHCSHVVYCTLQGHRRRLDCSRRHCIHIRDLLYQRRAGCVHVKLDDAALRCQRRYQCAARASDQLVSVSTTRALPKRYLGWLWWRSDALGGRFIALRCLSGLRRRDGEHDPFAVIDANPIALYGVYGERDALADGLTNADGQPVAVVDSNRHGHAVNVEDGERNTVGHADAKLDA